MSWVAEVKATSQKAAKVNWKKNEVGNEKAMHAKAIAMRNSMVTVHQRFVLTRSTNGLQKGLMTHGRYSQPV